MKVFVYRNLHKQCFSVKALEGPDKGRGCGHAIWDRLLYMGESAGARARAGLLKPDGVAPDTMKTLGLIIDHWYWVEARKAK